MDMATPSRPAQPPSPRKLDVAWRVLGVLLIGGLAAAFLWSLGAEQRAIDQMEPAQRREVYDRSLGELKSLCGAGPRDDALEKRCSEQIQFILKFPECDAPCREIARSHMPRPTK
jgi:hypothetical protein